MGCCASTVADHATVNNMNRPNERTSIFLTSTPLSLALTPKRRRKPWPVGGEFLRPDYRLFAVLPLEQHHLVSDLETILIDLERAEYGVGVKLQDGVTYLFAIEHAGAPHAFEQNLTGGISLSRLVREIRARKFLSIGGDELARARVLARDRHEASCPQGD